MSFKASADSAMPSESMARFNRWQRMQLSLIGFVGCVLIRAIGATLRYQVEGWENFQKLKDNREPIILSFWHNQIFLATEQFGILTSLTSQDIIFQEIHPEGPVSNDIFSVTAKKKPIMGGVRGVFTNYGTHSTKTRI